MRECHEGVGTAMKARYLFLVASVLVLIAGCGAKKAVMMGPIGPEGAATLQYMNLVSLKHRAVAVKLVAVQDKPVAEGIGELVELPPGTYGLTFRWLKADDDVAVVLLPSGAMTGAPSAVLTEPARRYQINARLEPRRTYRVRVSSQNALPDRLCLESRPSVDDELAFYKSGHSWQDSRIDGCGG